MASAARIIEHVRHLPAHISAGLGFGRHFATVLTRRGEFTGVFAFDANPTASDFELSVAPMGHNWFSPSRTQRILYSEIVEIRCANRVWRPDAS